MESNNVFVERYLTPLAVLLAAVIIAVAFIYGRSATSDNNDQGANGAPTVDIASVDANSGPFIGDPSAPATVAYYFDYQCPFCQQFEQQVMPQIISNYVDNGKAKVLIKDFQFLGQDSLDTAVFGRALFEAQPDLFYPWFVATFNAQDEEGDEGFGDLASNVALARTIPGLDVARVQALIAEKRDTYEAAIAADRAEGSSLGINGTPTVIVGDQLLSGMSPEQFYQTISAEIDENLGS